MSSQGEKAAELAREKAREKASAMSSKGEKSAELARELAREKASLLGKSAKTEMFDRVVDRKQFGEWPQSTLYCAFGLRVLIIVGVMLTVVGMIYGYFAGAIELSSATTKHTTLPFKRLVICPTWGQSNLKLENTHMAEGNLFSQDLRGWHEKKSFSLKKCPDFKFFKFYHETPVLEKMDELKAVNDIGCMCLDANVDLAVRDLGKDYLRIAFTPSYEAETQVKSLAIGVTGGGDDYPTDWNYVGIGLRTVADLTIEEYVYGSSPITAGTTIASYTIGIKNAFDTPEEQRFPGANTELILAFGSYYTTTILDVSAVFSVLAIATFLGVLLATLNSLQIFDLCFPEVVDPENPIQREPAWIFQQTFGILSGCCRKPS